MNWKRVGIDELSDGTIVRAANNLVISSFRNLEDTKGVYKIQDGGSVTHIRKGSLGIVYNNDGKRKIHIISLNHLNEVLTKVEKTEKQFKFEPMEIIGLLKDKTHTLKIDFHLLNDFEALV